MCLSGSRRARIVAQIKIKEMQLEKANALYCELLENPNSSYRFEDGTNGAQQVGSRKLDDVKKQIDSLNSEIDRLYRLLEGRGITSVILRRVNR